MKYLNWIAWAMVIALSILVIIQQRTINNYKTMNGAYEKAVQGYQEIIRESVRR